MKRDLVYLCATEVVKRIRVFIDILTLRIKMCKFAEE